MRLNREYLRKLLKDKSELRTMVQEVSMREWNEVTDLALGYNDASVKYHRSYSMTFTSTEVNVKVMSHDRILACYAENISDEQFAQLKELLRRQNIRKVEEQDSGMTGGSGGYISLMKGNYMLFSAYIYGNQWTTDGNLSFDGFLFDAPFSIFPWLEEKISELVSSQL